MDLNNFFDLCVEVQNQDNKNLQLLEKILNVASPMEFSDDFASDEDIELMITEMERADSRIPRIEIFTNLIKEIPAARGNSRIFI